MHKSFDGLCFLVETNFPDKLLTCSMFVFVNRQKNKLKILYWDTDGLVIWYKRHEKGTFKVDRNGRLRRHVFGQKSERFIDAASKDELFHGLNLDKILRSILLYLNVIMLKTLIFVKYIKNGILYFKTMEYGFY
jgi:hypothetical protein